MIQYNTVLKVLEMNVGLFNLFIFRFRLKTLKCILWSDKFIHREVQVKNFVHRDAQVKDLLHREV